jgi:hypothetical protein
MHVVFYTYIVFFLQAAVGDAIIFFMHTNVLI